MCGDRDDRVIVPEIVPGWFAVNRNPKHQSVQTVCCLPGIYTFGLFATDIFVNAGQVVTGNLAPHFLALCKPNYTALGCQQLTQFISGAEACTGNPDLITRARKTFPSKEAALSIYAAMYLTVSATCGLSSPARHAPRVAVPLATSCRPFDLG